MIPNKIPPRPLVPIAVSFIIGIIIAQNYAFNQSALLIASAIIILPWIILFSLNRLETLRIILISLLCVLVGLLRFYSSNELPLSDIGSFASEHVPIKVTGIVTNEPVITNDSSDSSREEKDDDDWMRWEQIKGWFILSCEKLQIQEVTENEAPCTKNTGYQNKERNSSEANHPSSLKDSGLRNGSPSAEATGYSAKENKSGLIRVSFSGFIPDIKYGDRIEVTGLIYSPRPPSNPGQFDYRKYLARQKIHKVISVVKPEDILAISRDNGNKFLSLIHSVRQKLRQTIENDFKGSQKGLLLAMLLGEKTSALSDDLQDDFRNTGTIHLLVVSGLHIVMVLALFVLLMGIIGVTGRLRSIILIALTLLYVSLMGWDYPVMRAGIMAIVYFSSGLFLRKSNPINSLALSALIILGINPNELFNIGFQLSFICVLAITIFTSEIMRIFPTENKPLMEIIPQTFPEKLLRTLKLYLFSSVSVSLAAWIGSILIIAYNFHVITPVIILANIALGTIILAALTIGMIYLPFGLLGMPLIFPQMLSALMNISTIIAHFFANLPFAYFYIPDLPLWIVLAYYSVFCLWYLKPYLTIIHSTASSTVIPAKAGIQKPGWIPAFAGMTTKKYISLLSGLTILLIISWILIVLIPLRTNKQDSLNITMIDVGQGASFFIELPDGKNILFDAGNQSSFDSGKGIIAPFLWNKGVVKIDTVIISHPHMDHFNALPSLLDRFRIGEVIINKEWFHKDGSGNGKRILRFLNEKWFTGNMIKRIEYGETVYSTGEVEIKALGPPSWEYVESAKLAPRDNDLSIVLQIKYQGKSILLPADIQSTGIRWLLTSDFSDVRSEIMQMPHHGYKEPMIPSLIEFIQPSYVLINGTKKNISQEIIELCNTKGIKIFASYNYGAVTAKINSFGTAINTFLLPQE
jgi:competence protein ComEC